MATKWNGWTSRLPVKIVSVLLIPAAAFCFLFALLGLARTGGDVNEDILFTNLANNDYFFDRYMPPALRNVREAFFFESEELIRAGTYLEWKDGGADWEERYDWGEARYRLTFRESYSEGSWSFADDMDSPEAEEIYQNALNNQLNRYFDSVSWLERQEGLFYYISDGERALSNLPEERQTAEFFRSQPVYHMRDGARVSEQSTESYYVNYDNGFWEEEGSVAYIAYSADVVNAQNLEWRVTQQQLGRQLVRMAVPAVTAVILLLVLLAGSGRRYGAEGGEVHFTVLDKPWLDIGFALLVLYEFALCSGVYFAANAAWRYSNQRWMIVLCAVMAVFFTLPLLWWLASFVKRCKAGRFWRYTLLYRLLSGIVSGLRRLARSLWAGFPLTLRVGLIGAVLFAAVFFCVLIGFEVDPAMGGLCVFFVSAAAVVGMLWHARRLRVVEEGARAASGGNYDVPINVKGGELGSIADSIRRISDGIGAAVTERMKSERFKTELITNVSHDIRTPLTSIITYTDLLRSEGLDGENAVGYLDILTQKAARLKALTDDLFEAAKAASGSVEARLETLDLSDFVRQALGELDERVRESGLDFRLSLPEHAPVLADGKLLWRVLDNLLSNVFKYALAHSRVYIDITSEGDSYRLDVKNISEHPLNVEPSELTERFKRGDDARSGEGSGLGLSIAQSFVQSQGGRFALSIDGDLFKATLRLARAAGEALRPVSGADADE